MVDWYPDNEETQGRTLDEAKANLFEVVKIQFDEMREQGSLDEYLSECGFLKKGDIIEPQSEIMGFSGLKGGHFHLLVPETGNIDHSSNLAATSSESQSAPH